MWRRRSVLLGRNLLRLRGFVSANTDDDLVPLAEARRGIRSNPVHRPRTSADITLQPRESTEYHRDP